jgi:hypothetical protein
MSNHFMFDVECRRNNGSVFVWTAREPTSVKFGKHSGNRVLSLRQGVVESYEPPIRREATGK